MLTEVNLKEHLIKAYFVNEDRTIIEVLYTSKDFKETHSHIVEYDVKHPDCQELLKVMNLDDLHESTYQQKKDERRLFEEEAIKIAKRSGMVFDMNRIDTKFYPTMVKAIFEETDNEDHLFALKLALFEVEQIRDSKNDELKKKIRQSKTKADCLMAAFTIVQESN
tara:strand:+ start:7393 stop:7890 length:498 start_codon:yes stop_codon:yes gene_type:complete